MPTLSLLSSSVSTTGRSQSGPRRTSGCMDRSYTGYLTLSSLATGSSSALLRTSPSAALSLCSELGAGVNNAGTRRPLYWTSAATGHLTVSSSDGAARRVSARHPGVLSCQRPDHMDQLTRLIWLAEKTPTLRHILIANPHLARRKHKLDWWPTVTDGVRKS